RTDLRRGENCWATAARICERTSPEHLQPLPEHDYFEFFANDSSLYPHMFSRAYINFKNQEDIVLFRDRFDGYVFVDHKGQEYAAIVEFAPFQKAAKKKSKKKDAKTGTIEDDPEYKKFLESYSADDEKLTSTPETLLEEIEARNKELIEMFCSVELHYFSLLFNTQRLREEKREERRRRELERKRQREEERRKWKEEERRKRKEAEKLKKVDRCPEKERDRSKEEPKIKRAQREKQRRQEEERRRQSERFEKLFRRREEEVKKERDLIREKGKKSDLTDFTSSMDKSEKVTKDDKKEDTIKRDRIRNKDRPAMQLYQPGARSRSRLCQYEDSAAKPTDQGVDKKQEREISNMKEEE
uniref:UPF3B regulator of nonsense mediated mRNA decay n=1 Tax=Athene cunicularia TaxID=194338 RepID=A0A663M5F5_ATHCN